MNISEVWLRRFIIAIASGLCMSIAACDGDSGDPSPSATTEAQKPAASVAPPPPEGIYYKWGAIPGSSVEAGPPAKLSLRDNYVYAIMRKAEVFPGDVVTSTLEVSGPAGRAVTLILQRHCSPANGDDYELHSFVLTGAQQTEVMSHKFERQYSCIRLSILSADKKPLDIVVHKLRSDATGGSGEATVFGTDPTLEQVKQNRDQFGKVVFYFGDSISRGSTLWKFPDEFSQEEAMQERHWRFRSPASTNNTTFDKKSIVAVYGGQNGQPNGGGEQTFSDLVSQRIIRSGDVVVLEDAGDQLQNPTQYGENWIAIRKALADAGVTIVMTTMADVVPAGSVALQYDKVFGTQSHNDATRAAAKVAVPGTSKTVLLDLDALLPDQSYFQDDGVHFNLMGQCIFATQVAKVAALPSPNCTGITSKR